MVSNHKINDKEMEKILANTKATLAMEDLYVTDQEEDIGRKYLKGEISKDEVYKMLGITKPVKK